MSYDPNYPVSHQCGKCHRFYAGPDEGYQPGREVTSAPKAHGNVSHGTCPTCRNAMSLTPEQSKAMEARYGQRYRDRLKQAEAEQRKPDRPPDPTHWWWRKRGGKGQ